MTNLQMTIASGQVSAAQIEAHRQAGDLNVTTQQAMPELPVVGYHGVDHDGYEVLAPKENQVLRMFDAGEVIAQPVCLVSDALTYAESLRSELEAARAALQLTYVELHHCSQQLVASGWTEGSTVRNALNVARAALSNTKEQSND